MTGCPLDALRMPGFAFDNRRMPSDALKCFLYQFRGFSNPRKANRMFAKRPRSEPWWEWSWHFWLCQNQLRDCRCCQWVLNPGASCVSLVWVMVLFKIRRKTILAGVRTDPISHFVKSSFLNVRADLWFEWMIHPWLKKSAGLEYWCANWLNWFRFQLLFAKHFSFENFLLASDSTESTSVAPCVWESSCRQQPCGFLSDSMASGKNSNSKTQIEMLQIVYPEVFFIQNAF